MSTSQVWIGCVTLVILYGMHLVAKTRQPYVDESHYDLVREKSTTVVTTHQGESIRGVVLESTEAYIELGEAAHLSSGGTQVNARGKMRIPRANVAYVQEVTPAEVHADTN